jgi:hypothetical protein
VKTDLVSNIYYFRYAIIVNRVNRVNFLVLAESRSYNLVGSVISLIFFSFRFP